MKFSSSIILAVMTMTLTKTKADYLRKMTETKEETELEFAKLGDAMSFDDAPKDVELEPAADMDHKLPAGESDDDDDGYYYDDEVEDGNERHLASGNCGIFAEDNYGYADAGKCYNLGGTYWNDKATWMRASADTCITVYEHHSGGRSLKYCGSSWYKLTTLSREVSRVCCSSSSGDGTGGGSGGGGGCGVDSSTNEVFTRTNQYRTQNGRSALSCNAGVSRVIQNYMGDLCRAGQLTHNLGGKSPGDRLNAAGISWSTCAENIAQGQTSPSSVVQAWINSSGHRKNLLNTSVDTIGVGYVYCNGARYWGQLFANL